MNLPNIAIKLLFFLVFLISVNSHAYAAPAGKAKMVIGKVMVQTATGASIRLRRGKPVSEGDKIITNERSQAQLIMKDGSNISIRPASEFEITAFVATGDVAKDKTHYTLSKGGFRSVTGSIGKKNKASFKLKTPVATMGIRGTDFTSRLCNGDCPANVSQNGLYVDVISGGVSMTNQAGSFDLTPDTNGFVGKPDQKPGRIDKFPENLLSPKRKNNSGRNGKKGYPSPEEEMVQISVYVDPENKNAIIQEAMEAGVAPKSIINGANSGGLNAEEIVPEIINRSKSLGISPSDLVQPILDSDIQSDNIIEDLMVQNPESAADILTAAFASGKMPEEQLKSSANNIGLNESEIKAAEALGGLLAVPEELQKILEESDSNSNDNSNDNSTPARIRARELAPTSDTQETASPS